MRSGGRGDSAGLRSLLTRECLIVSRYTLGSTLLKVLNVVNRSPLRDCADPPELDSDASINSLVRNPHPVAFFVSEVGFWFLGSGFDF